MRLHETSLHTAEGEADRELEDGMAGVQSVDASSLSADGALRSGEQGEDQGERSFHGGVPSRVRTVSRIVPSLCTRRVRTAKWSLLRIQLVTLGPFVWSVSLQQSNEPAGVAIFSEPSTRKLTGASTSLSTTAQPSTSTLKTARGWTSRPRK